MRVNTVWKVLAVLWVAAPVGAVFTLAKLKRHRERIDQGKFVSEMEPIVAPDSSPNDRESNAEPPCATPHAPQTH